MENPLETIRRLWLLARQEGSLQHRNAVCVSTLDPNGFPDGRFVDLKGVDDRGFVFCTHLGSNKAIALQANPKAAMTAWWEHIATQIRIKGACTALPDDEAEACWQTRPRDAQIASVAFAQSHPLKGPDLLPREYARVAAAHAEAPIERPENWGGFRLIPEAIEILEFKETRLHARTVYTLIEAHWHKGYLQP